MSHDHDRSRDRDGLAIRSDDRFDATPGRGTPSSQLAAPTHPIASRLVSEAQGPNDGIPQNSYNRGDLKWEGGTALEEEHAQAWYSKRAALLGMIGQVSGASGALGGLSKSTVVAQLRKRIDFKLDMARRTVEHYKGQVEHGAPEQMAQNIGQQAQCEQELIRIQSVQQSAYGLTATTVVDLVAKYAGYVSQVQGAIKMLLSNTNEMSPSAFKGMDDMMKKMTAAISTAQTLSQLCDRTAIVNFQSNPCFETAAAWGEHVGGVLHTLAGVAGQAPYGWGAVLEGLMDMPSVVIAQFTEVVRAHYERYDAMTADTSFGNGKVIPPGHSGGTPAPAER